MKFIVISIIFPYLLRLRIAQEIQRKLEELDVKLKTLEAEGVEVEKKLRGEGIKLKIIIYVLVFTLFKN